MKSNTMNSKQLIPVFLFLFSFSHCEKEVSLTPADPEPPVDSTNVVSPPDTSSDEPVDTTTTAPPDTIYSAFGAYFPLG